MEQSLKYFNSSLRFLGYRPRSEKEIRDNLKKKKADSLTIEKIVARLKEHKFLDDQDFARWWIQQRLAFKPRSLRLIKIELKQKGVGEEFIEKAIAEIESVANDLDRAKELIKRKLPKYKGLEKQQIYEKLGRFLASKGFNWETIKQGIDEMLKNGV